jgi:hypothetical protein
MAVVFLEPGSGHTYDLKFWSTPTVSHGTVTSDTQAVKLSPRSIKIVTDGTSGAYAELRKVGVLANAGRRISFYFRYYGTITDDTDIAILTDSSGNGEFLLFLSSTGHLTVANTAGTIVGTASGTLSADTDYRILIQYTKTSQSVNTINILVDGSNVIALTNIDTGAGAMSDFWIEQGYYNPVNSTTVAFYYAHIYIDDGTSGDPGDIRVTAKRPYGDGTAVQFTTQIGSGNSGYGSGHADEVNERALSETNGWSLATTSAVTRNEEYNIENAATGDNDLTGATIVGVMGWMDANLSSTTNQTGGIIVDGTYTAKSLTTSYAIYTQLSATPTTYPAGTGTDIGMRKVTATTTSRTGRLAECGIIVAYIPPNTAPTVALSTPTDTATNQSVTPNLVFTGTDPNADEVEYEVQLQATAFGDVTTGYSTKGGSGGSPQLNKMWGSKFTTGSVGGTVQGIHCWCYNDSGTGTHLKLVIVKASDLTIVTNGVSSVINIPYGANAAAATQMDATFATAPVLAASTDYFLMAIHDDASWAVYITYDAGSANQHYEDSSNSYSSPTDPTDATASGDGPDRKYSIWVTYTPTPLLDVLSSTESPSHFSGTGDPHPWPSGNAITYAVQAAVNLQASTTYYWRARAIDPSGSNTWGAWPTAFSFTTAAEGGATVVKDLIMMGIIPFPR